jgi:hypothetical protein
MGGFSLQLMIGGQARKAAKDCDAPGTGSLRQNAAKSRPIEAKVPSICGLEFPFPMETEINCACFQAELVRAHADPASA